jgi:endonuclease YncB( thermonuclease family)
LDLDVDLGFHVHVHVRIRVIGVDAPERNTREGRAADLFAITLLGGAPNVTVRTEFDRSFERWLGEITLPDGTDYAARLIDAGHGVPYERT